MEKVSIIIPVYKAESYLDKCIRSVMSQTHKNMEIILIDDGSPDSCPELCDKYASEDSRVKVIHKTNGGASSARNCGLENAEGKYICFVDSDDIVPDCGVELLVNSMEENAVDFVAGICVVAETGKPKNYIASDFVIDFNKDPIDLLKYITGSGSYSPYAKLYSTNIIKEHRIRFDENLKCSEDALFIRTYFSYCDKMSFVARPVYEYTATNVNSLSKKGYPEFCEYYVKKIEALEGLCNHLELSSSDKNRFLFERAVHGLKISINHYINHWTDKNTLHELISRSVDLLHNWLDLYDESNCTTLTINKRLLIWWKNSKDLIGNGGLHKFCEKEIKNHNNQTITDKLKKIAKRMLKR